MSDGAKGIDANLFKILLLTGSDFKGAAIILCDQHYKLLARALLIMRIFELL